MVGTLGGSEPRAPIRRLPGEKGLLALLAVLRDRKRVEQVLGKITA